LLRAGHGEWKEGRKKKVVPKPEAYPHALDWRWAQHSSKAQLCSRTESARKKLIQYPATKRLIGRAKDPAKRVLGRGVRGAIINPYLVHQTHDIGETI